MPTATSELLPGYSLDPATGAWVTLPWPDDPDARAELARISLGPQIIAWAEGRTDEPGLIDYQTGGPWRFTRGQKRFLVLWYAANPNGRWLYRSGVKRGAKGTGKDPFGAAMCDIELIGPSQISHMVDGHPVGQRHNMPLVQIASNSEAQSKDMLRIANALLPRETREFYSIDCGETRTILTDGGGRLEVLTASEASSEGDPATFIALNESHHMTESSGGHKVTAVARRNVGKSPKAIQARMVEYTNAHQQGTDSTAERSFEAWQQQVSGKFARLKQDILYDSIEADPGLDIFDDTERAIALQQSYSDAPWSDLERIGDEVLDPRTTVADSIRFYMNGLAAAEDAWVEPAAFDELKAEDTVVEDGEAIALFLDCSKSEDATGLVACRLSDEFCFLIDGDSVWQKPRGVRGKGWLAPRAEVDAKVRSAFERYRVVWFGVDPSPATDDDDEALYWAALLDEWHQDFAKKLRIWATPGSKGHSVKFDMRLSQPGAVERNRLFTEQAERVAHEIDEDKTLTWDGSPALRLHVHNSRRRPNKWGVSLGKVNRDSTKLVDLAVCMVGAKLGARLVKNAGKFSTKTSTTKTKAKARVL